MVAANGYVHISSSKTYNCDLFEKTIFADVLKDLEMRSS